MAKKTIKELEEEVQKLIKVNNSNFIEHQKVEMDLFGKIRLKDKEIANLKNKLEDVSNMKLKQENTSLQEQVDRLEFEEETDKKIISKLLGTRDELQCVQSDLKMQLKDKEGLIKVQEETLSELKAKF